MLVATQTGSPAPLSIRHDVQGDMETRICPRCDVEQPLESFCKDNRRKSGRACYCRGCVKRYNLKTHAHRESYRFSYRSNVKNRARLLVGGALRRAKKRGLPCDISVDDIAQRLGKGICEVTGIPFNLTNVGRVNWCWKSPSLDQIVPGIGYLSSNVQVVIRGYNVMKNNWGDAPILLVAEALKGKQQ